jgi:hypothetical protein
LNFCGEDMGADARREKPFTEILNIFQIILSVFFSIACGTENGAWPEGAWFDFETSLGNFRS